MRPFGAPFEHHMEYLQVLFLYAAALLLPRRASFDEALAPLTIGNVTTQTGAER